MYPVTRIISDDGSKEVYVVCGDGGYRITQHDFTEMEISEGDVLSEEEYAQLIEASDRLRCVKKAFEYLSYGDLSVKQLYDKLCRKFPKELSMDVAELMREHSYVDDRKLACRYAETFYVFKNFGLIKIREELYRRGIGKEDTEAALAPYIQEDQVPRVIEYAKKKYELSGLSDPKYRRKVYSGLMRAGFACSDITDALNKIESEQIWQ